MTIGLGTVRLGEFTTPFGRRLTVELDIDEDDDGALMDAREVEELRDACQRFLDGQPV